MLLAQTKMTADINDYHGIGLTFHPYSSGDIYNSVFTFNFSFTFPITRIIIPHLKYTKILTESRHQNLDNHHKITLKNYIIGGIFYTT